MHFTIIEPLIIVRIVKLKTYIENSLSSQDSFIVIQIFYLQLQFLYWNAPNYIVKMYEIFSLQHLRDALPVGLHSRFCRRRSVITISPITYCELLPASEYNLLDR